jgi:hypothetical protein
MKVMAETPKALDRKAFEGAPISDMAGPLLRENCHLHVPLPVVCAMRIWSIRLVGLLFEPMVRFHLTGSATFCQLK